MTPEQINLIQRNFAAIAPQSETLAASFYNRLFIMQPVLRLLFPTDLTAQKKKLMATLALAVKSLGEPEKLIPVLEDLGRRHALYGVRDEYYETVGAALLESLREALGEEYTTESAAAWSAMYGFVAATMKRAAREMSDQPENTKKTEEQLKMKKITDQAKQLILTTILIACFGFATLAQTTEFTYQGRLTAGARPANATFQMKFALLDAGGNRIAPANEDRIVATAGSVTISGGAVIRNAVITLTNSSRETRTTVAGSFGYFRFAEVEAGATYLVSVASKRFVFGNAVEIVSVSESRDDLEFIADPQ